MAEETKNVSPYLLRPCRRREDVGREGTKRTTGEKRPEPGAGQAKPSPAEKDVSDVRNHG